ncbi:unnamed protein product [Zymoseptoria tritici ST99CH_1E4]|uniref:F-box domain-containing protein n=1 Tax=Zymoseptoria tritici ST99CH_1E4 TaxID=1276532 RepID=A0A2H1G3H2_ZYMTR|nr:unnamed protein product [Zymoseptoria tritici ST99CH_1E4]
MGLEELPPELIERIALLLPLPDICSFRLSSRNMEAGGTHSHFKTHFYEKRIKVTEPELRKFAETVAAGGLPCLLRHVTLVAPLYDPEYLQCDADDKAMEIAGLNAVNVEDVQDAQLDCMLAEIKGLEDDQAAQLEMRDRGLDFALLGEAFGSLARHEVTLHSVTTEVKVHKGDVSRARHPLDQACKPTFPTAAYLSRLIFRVLGSHEVPIRALHLFNTEAMQDCCVPVDWLKDVDFSRSSTAWQTLSSLSLSLSNKLINRYVGAEGVLGHGWLLDHRLPTRPYEELLAESKDSKNFTGLVRLLECCESLTSLELSRVSLGVTTNAISHAQDAGILHAVDQVKLSNLTSLKLQGFHTAQDQMLGLLRRHRSLQHLSLRDFGILQGQLQPILDYSTHLAGAFPLTTSAMSLQELPQEIFDEILQLLPLHDTCSLRLVNRALAFVATDTDFKARFRAKTVEMNETGLRRFAKAMKCGGLSLLLRDLTLAAQVYDINTISDEIDDKQISSFGPDTPYASDGTLQHVIQPLGPEELKKMEADMEEMDKQDEELQKFQESKMDVFLLGAAFSGLDKHGIALDSIRAEVILYQQDSSTPVLPLWGFDDQPTWAAANYLTQVILNSLNLSDFHVEKLDLFNSDRMVGCSLAIDALSKVKFSNSLSALRNLKCLSLSISEGYDATAEELDPAYFEGFAGLLRGCSNLTHLDLADYRLAMYKHEDNPELYLLQSRGIVQALNEAQLPKLQTLKLQGFHLNEEQLLSIIQARHTLHQLSLRAIHLQGGRFQPILDYCTQDTKLKDILLDSLFNQGKLQFSPPWAIDESIENPTYDGYVDLKAHWRRGPDAGKIEYTIYGGGIRNVTELNWEQNIENWYGPHPDGQSRARHLLRPEEIWRALI